MQKREVSTWVTSKNQIWASEVTGLSLEEIKRRYEEARAKKVVCTIKTTVFFSEDEEEVNYKRSINPDGGYVDTNN